jgi:hypothetical protein
MDTGRQELGSRRRMKASHYTTYAMKWPRHVTHQMWREYVMILCE